ncbi:PD-(D/E)XK nuclease family protein [Onishia niordana]|uniref:PD-(D/E)XK nuclease family protein n=1 Tax=Onishia niordana TaxID=2508711 RepID=UPI00109F4AD8|nr:PD-(D/E)XK nuclease family protein [Halomonas niordiana]
MDVDDIKALLDGVRRFQPAPRERTLFDIGGRGYFENPTSDLLAFFLDPDAEHGFADEVLAAVLDCLPESAQPPEEARYLAQSPRREWGTSHQKRLDLVLESDQWVLGLENKIHHTLANDFDHYASELAARMASNEGKRLIRVLLSPDGNTPDSGWIGITYAQLLKQLNDRVGQLFASQPMNKWLIFLREFVIHLETTTMTTTVTDDQQAFVLENLGEIHELNKLQKHALEATRERLLARLSELTEGEHQPFHSWQENWPVGPALSFRHESWQEPSRVVVFLPYDTTKNAARIQVYVDRKNGSFEDLAHRGFAPERFHSTSADNSTLVFFRDFSELDWPRIEHEMVMNMSALMELEASRQPITQ